MNFSQPKINPKELKNKDLEVKVGRREFLNSIYLSLFGATFLGTFYADTVKAQREMLIDEVFSSSAIQKIQSLIKIYEANGKLDKINIIRRESDQKLVFSFVGRINWRIKSSYENDEREFNKLKIELQSQLFGEMRDMTDFKMILSGILIEFLNMK